MGNSLVLHSSEGDYEIGTLEFDGDANAQFNYQIVSNTFDSIRVGKRVRLINENAPMSSRKPTTQSSVFLSEP